MKLMSKSKRIKALDYELSKVKNRLFYTEEENKRLEEKVRFYKKSNLGECSIGEYCEHCKYGQVSTQPILQGAYFSIDRSYTCLKNVSCQSFVRKSD